VSTIDTFPTSSLQFVLPPSLEAREPPEARGRGRDDVRLLVSVGTRPPVDACFDQLDQFLEPGDLLLVNTSATLAASLGALDEQDRRVEVHLSTRLPGGLWLVEVRQPDRVASSPDFSDRTGTTLRIVGRDGVLPEGGPVVHLLTRFRESQRLWLATLDLAGATLTGVLDAHGRPIRYRHVPEAWPIDAYQTVFSDEPGSAEMPSASRPFTPELVTRLVRRGIELVPLLLHTGVSSLEGGERPYPEWFRVPASTAARVESARRHGHRVVAVGTTAVRAIESAVRPDGSVEGREGWTDLVVTPESGVRVVDGLITGWHEPEASHLLMLEAIAGRPALELAYGAAIDAGYRWHEFGDIHLILPEPLTSVV
jgi:S-adenosylmethionine:tRNA ribosyltransferase-isomerase